MSGARLLCVVFKGHVVGCGGMRLWFVATMPSEGGSLADGNAVLPLLLQTAVTACSRAVTRALFMAAILLA